MQIILRALLIMCPILCLAQIWTPEDGSAISNINLSIFMNANDSDIICRSKKCISKCCPENYYVQLTNESSFECTTWNETLNFFDVPVHDENVHDKKVNKNISDLFIINTNKFSDTEFTQQWPYPLAGKETGFRNYLSENGILYLDFVNSYPRWKPIDSDNYCVDYLVGESNPELKFWVVMSGEGEGNNSDFYMAMLITSIVFLFLVLVVYSLLSELRNLAGKVLMAYVFSLMAAFVLLLILQYVTLTETECVICTALDYFFFLASFCWMNVMSYDIFWTFRGYAKARPIHRRGENFKFLMYSLYGCGVPLAMAIMLVVVNSQDLSEYPWIIQPQIPRFGCFLTDGRKLLYLYIPMLILILCNWFFFLMTTFNIWRLHRGTVVLHSPAAGNSAAHSSQINRFYLYLKLSIIMGINWVLEVISSFYPKWKIWWISDAYNLLIGLSIFIIFVAKRKIINDLMKKFRRVKYTIRNSTNSTVESNISQDIPMTVSKYPGGSVHTRSNGL